MLDQQEYLQRIGYTGDLTPTLDTLHKLQRTHILHIPFENLDIHYGVPIVLELDKIYQKVILNGRGGFCYELNGLYQQLLYQLGFQTRRISARVFDEKTGYGQEFDHLVTIVIINGVEYLTDVGFGEFAFGPLELKLDKIQKDERGDFFIQEMENGYLRVNKLIDGLPRPEYIFKNIHREYKAYAAMCHFHQTHPDSHFTRNKFITIGKDKGGRITLSQNKLKITKGDSFEETPINNQNEFEETLKKYFGICMENIKG